MPKKSTVELRVIFAGWHVLEARMKQSMSVPQSVGPAAFWTGTEGVMFCTEGAIGWVGMEGALAEGTTTRK